jgi:hypothetical protein
MNFSIVLASRERIPLLIAFLNSLVDTTHDLSNIEVLVGIDNCDQMSCDHEVELSRKYPFVKFFRRDRSKFLNQDYLNWLSQMSVGRFIIACNDDVEVRTKHWDKIAMNSLNAYLADKPDEIVYGFIEDGLGNRHGMDYCCFPLFSRKGYNTLGWLLPGCFMSWNADIAAWRVYHAVGRVVKLPIMFNHVSYHTGQRERDHISHRMETLSHETGINGAAYDVGQDVDKLQKVMNLGIVPVPVGKNGVIYSFLVPTRERPELLESFIESVSRTTFQKSHVEICVAYDSDDKKTSSQIGKFNRQFGSLVKFYGKTRSNMINRDYVNWLYKFSSGSFVISCNDDCKILTSGWDQLVTEKLRSYLADKPDGIVYGKTIDNMPDHRGLNYSCFPLVSRAAVDTLGYVMNPDFPSLGAEIHLGRVYEAAGRVMDLSCLNIDHICHYNNKRSRDTVNMCLERQASRITLDPIRMDICKDANKLGAQIEKIAGTITTSSPSSSKKPNLLFVTEKWCDGSPQAGITNSYHNLFGSLELADIASFEALHFDEYFLQHGRNVDNELLRFCHEKRPDVVVSTYLCNPAKMNVKKETWEHIQKMGIPVVFIWFDAVLPFVADIANSLAPYSALSVALDTSDIEVPNKDKFLGMWTPQDTRYYFNPHTKRDIDVCFLGSTKGYIDRIVGIEALKYNGIEVMQMGGQRENPLPLESYVNIMQRSKICLNFPRYRGVPNLVQAKGRIFEATLCGAMLMDGDNDQTKKWFTSGGHYVSFTDESDLVAKVKYYLEKEDERNEIAQAGWLHCSTFYSPRSFWKTIFNRIGL